MSKVPSYPSEKVIAARKRDGRVEVRERASDIRLQKPTRTDVFRPTVPAHWPIKLSYLSRILKQACLYPEEILELL